jgi:hypothetical protein
MKRRLWKAVMLCAWLCACHGAEPIAMDGQTHWLTACNADAECGPLSCICGVCVAPCDGAGRCAVRGRDTECRERDAAPVVAMCAGQAPSPICLESCRGGCPADQRCDDGVCVVDPEGRDAGGPNSEGDSGGADASTVADASAADASTGTDASAPDAASASDAGVRFTCSELPAVSPQFDRSCARASDCSQVTQQVDCCGTLHVTGIRADEAERFGEAATTWGQECVDIFPQCGCAARDAFADDGSSVPAFGVVQLPATVDCVSGTCTTAFIELTTVCGLSGLTCDALTEVCVARPAGPALQYSCQPVPPRCEQERSCACAGEALCPGTLGPCQERGPNSIECTCPACV